MKFELFSAAFWGVLLIIIGVLLVIKYVFNIQFPVGRIVIAVLFIYFGLRLLLGNQGMFCCGKSSCSNYTAFSDREFKYSPSENEYRCVFGSSRLDLSDVQIAENKTIELSVAFGEFRVKINRNSNVEIISNTAFGSTFTQDNSVNGFGERTFRMPGFNEALPRLTIKTNVAFGSMKFIYSY
jgi:predicted membrane protein